MKKLLALSLVVVLLAGFALVACGDDSKAPGDDKSSSVASVDFKAACVVGSIGDKSFADAAWNGFKDAKTTLGIHIKLVETQNDTTRNEPTIQDLGDAGYDFVACTGITFAEILERIAADYPDTYFLVYDVSRDYVNLMPNVAIVIYAQNEGDYLCGVMAAQMTKTGVLGFLGGMEQPVIQDFLLGFIEGATWSKAGTKVAVTYAGAYNDAPKGKEFTEVMINQYNADIIHGVAGGSGMGAIEASANSDKVLWYIGVDADQYEMLKDTQPEMAKKIVTSSLKKIGESLARACKELLESNGTDPDYYGETVVWGVAIDGTGIAKNEMYEKNVPEDVKAKVEEAITKIKDGTIEVTTAYGMAIEDILAIQNSVKPS